MTPMPDTETAVLRELVDRQQIADLVHAYCFHFDNNEPEAVAALFTDDAEVDYGPEFPRIHGAAAVAASIAFGLEHTFAVTSHHVSNLVVTFDGADAADATTYLYAWHRYVDSRPESELWGRYRHRFVRTRGGWRIAALRLEAAGTRDFHRARMHPIGRR